MLKNIREWFDKEIKWAEDESEERAFESCCNGYYEGYKEAMEKAKKKLSGEEVI